MDRETLRLRRSAGNSRERPGRGSCFPRCRPQPSAHESAERSGLIGFVKRRKVLSGIVVGVLFFGMVGALSGGGDDPTTPVAIATADAPSESSAPSSSPPPSPTETAEEVAATPTPAPTTEPEPTQAAEPQGTAAQMNALRSAEDYLSFKGFSKAGLIEQLSSEYGEGYEKADAEWAVEQLDVNWNEQAVRVAQDYLDMKGFSEERPHRAVEQRVWRAIHREAGQLRRRRSRSLYKLDTSSR